MMDFYAVLYLNNINDISNINNKYREMETHFLKRIKILYFLTKFWLKAIERRISKCLELLRRTAHAPRC